MMKPQPKPTPRALQKHDHRKAAAKMDREQKAAVRLRDKKRCRVCGRASSEVHEMKFKSLGGVASLQNSFVACSLMNGGGLCHALLQSHSVTVIGEDANGPLIFEMNEMAARAVFGHRSPPSHVRIV